MFKTRIVCPCCGNGFLVNSQRVISFCIDKSKPYATNEDRVPRCNNCGRLFNVSFDTIDFVIGLEECHIYD